MKRCVTFLLTLSLLLCFSLTVHAHDIPEAREDCSIELIVRYAGEDISGGTLTAVRVGYVDEENGDYFFSQEKTGLKLEDITSADAPEIQRQFYDENKDAYPFYTQTRNVENGKAVFTDLPTGLYLIIQEQAAEGFSPLGAFLISVPYLEDGEYRYHVTATIKSELEREPATEPTAPVPPVPDDPKLPQTGQLNWPIPLMAAAGIGLFITGWVLCFGKKRTV
jgi:LPXTG-motif cell wall-anchored protein